MQTPLHSFPLDVTYATTEVHLWPVVSGSSRCQGLCISQELVSSEQLWLWIAQQSRSTSGLTSLFFICLAVTLPLVAAIFRQGSPQQRDHVLLFGTFCSTKLIVRSLCEKKKDYVYVVFKGDYHSFYTAGEACGHVEISPHAGILQFIPKVNNCFSLGCLFSPLFTCSRPHLAGPAFAALTATPAPPLCGDATPRESLCVTPVAFTWSCTG